MQVVTKDDVLKATANVNVKLCNEAGESGVPDELCEMMFMQYVIFSAELMKNLFGENYDREDNDDGTYSSDFS